MVICGEHDFIFPMDVYLTQSDQEIHDACQVLNELRPQYSLEELIQTVKEQQGKGYHLAICREDDTCLGAIGFVIGHKLAWKKHMYIDDLVVTEKSRSKGAGAAMLAWITEYARENGCKQIHLDSGVQRFGAHKFYLKHGFIIASHHFSRVEK